MPLRTKGIWILILIATVNGYTQDFPDLVFEHQTIREGLSSNFVTSITQDHQGFIWVGTTNGLNRFDGYRFRQYYHSTRDSNSIINNQVQTLYCDSRGQLWIGTEDGVSCFIPSENRFINFSTKMPTSRRLKNNSSVRIYEDATGHIWITNQADVIYLVLPDHTLQEKRIDVPAFQYSHLSMEGYEKIYRDRAGKEWAIRANRIYLLNRETLQPEKIFDLSPQLTSLILKMYQATDGTYYLTTWDSGVWKFNPDPGNIVQLVSLPKGVYSDITEWQYQKKQWLVCLEANKGVYLFNQATGASRKYGHVAEDPTSLAGTEFNATFVDPKGNLWICSTAGIHKIKTEKDIFDIIPITESGTSNYQFDKSSQVYSFYENDTSIWLSKRFISTFQLDTSFQIKSTYTSLYPLSAGTTNSTRGAYYFYPYQDELYITTDSGLIIKNLRIQTSAVYLPTDIAGIPDLRTIIPFHTDEILIRSFSYGLFVFNTREKKFTRHFNSGSSCDTCLPLRINYLFTSSAGKIYITCGGEEKSFFTYQPEADAFMPLIPKNDSLYAMYGSDLYGMDEDPDGNLWITSKSGLFVYDPVTNAVITNHNEIDKIGGLIRICFDEDGNAWTNGDSGIWCYLASRKKWVGYTSDDGLPGSSFDGIITKRKNGDIVAGLEGAVAIFHPHTLGAKGNTYPVIITEANVDSTLISFPLQSSVTKTLRIAPGQNSFSVDFAILNDLNPSSSRYYYKLAPLMESFQLNDDGHINFNGLAPGAYTLTVKSGDKAGNLYAQEDSLTITVSPHWYQTAIFKMACLLVLLGLIYYFVRRRIETIRKENTLHQKIAHTEMQALRAQMNPHFIFNSLNSIENFILQNEKRLASDYLNKFSRLIRSILDSSRNEVVPLMKDIESLGLYVELEQLRFNHRFTYSTQIDPALKDGDYKVPSLIIQPYVENAILHGLALSHKQGLILSVAATLESDHIKYTIRDNGIGRRQAMEYTFRNKPHHKSVGLTITEDRIAHFNKQPYANGSVTITDLYDAEGQAAGTCVEVTLKTN